MYRKGAERALGVWVGWGGVGRGALGSAWSFIHSRSPVLRVLVFPFKNYSRKNNNKNAQCVQFMFIHGVSGESGGVCMKPTGSISTFMKKVLHSKKSGCISLLLVVCA